MFYFALGVLSVLALFLIGVLIYGMVKVSKLTSFFKNLEETTHRNYDDIHHRMYDVKKDMDTVISNIYSRIDSVYHDCTSYTDKRIDKSLNNKETHQ